MNNFKELSEKLLQDLTKSGSVDYLEVINYIKSHEAEKLKSFIEEKKFNLNELHGSKMRPLEYAIYTKNMEMVNLLTELGANVNVYQKGAYQEYPILGKACVAGEEYLENLISKGMKVNNKTGVNSLNMAIINWQLNVATLLIEKGVNYKKVSYTNVHPSMVEKIQKIIENHEIQLEKERLDKKIKNKKLSKT